MTTAAPSTALATIQPAFTDAERRALAGYRGLTREAYALDLRQFTTWCRARSVSLFAVRRADIETFARDLEARGRARATITRRLSTIAGFYKYAVQEELLARSPAAHVRRPRVDYESHAVALDRNELGALLVAAGRSRSAMSRRQPPLRTRGPRCGMTGARQPGPARHLHRRSLPRGRCQVTHRLASASPGGHPLGEAARHRSDHLAAVTQRDSPSEREPPIWSAAYSVAVAIGAVPKD